MPTTDAMNICYLWGVHSIVVLYDSRQWQPRNLKHRGWSSFTAITNRYLNDGEETELSRYRLISYTYTDWEKLLSDEQMLGSSTEFIEKLRAFAEKNPIRPKQLKLEEQSHGAIEE